MGGGRLGLAAPPRQAHAHDAASAILAVSARQPDSEFSELPDPAIDGDRAAMLLGHDVVADREAEPGPLAGRLCREKRLKQLVLDLRGNACTVVPYRDLDRISDLVSTPSEWA
jgi:hypothetical protein